MFLSPMQCNLCPVGPELVLFTQLARHTLKVILEKTAYISLYCVIDI